LGGEVMFVARVGNDLFGREAKKHFQAEKINTEFIMLDDTLPSCRCRLRRTASSRSPRR
jgi:ribokinase